jgi:CBS domain containing-hemolysin-like protein
LDTDSSFLCFAFLVVFSGLLSYAKVSLLFLRKQKPVNGNDTHPAQPGQADESDHAQFNLLIGKADDYLMTIFTVQNIVKAAAVIFLYNGLSAPTASGRVMFSFTGAMLLTLSGAFLFLLGLSEIIVRIPARKNVEHASKLIFGPVIALHFLARPLTLILEPLIKWHIGIINKKNESSDVPAVAEDFIDENGTAPKLEESEIEMIESIVEFKDTIVREVMAPRVDMKCILVETTLCEAREKIVEYRHSRLPVYRDNIDNIVGVVLARDLLEYVGKEGWERMRAEEIMHDVNFIPETKNISDLLREFQKTETQFAIVVDEYGGTSGLVSIEDLLEEIVGEIRDEFDTEQPLFTATADGSFIVDAKMTISEVEEELNIELPEESEYDTVGGYVVTRMGKVPKKGEVFDENGFKITIIEADDRKIHKIKLSTTTQKHDSENGNKT